MPSSQLPDNLTKYLRRLHLSDDPILHEMEAIAEKEGFPIIGPECGRILATMAVAVGAKRVFEMGSGYGYSTVWFAHAVGETGEVVHTDGDERNTERAKEFLGKAGLADRCRFRTGDAMEILSKEDGLFDCILIDVDKEGYPLALQVAVEKLRYGGLIMTHNTIWSGKVSEEGTDDPQTFGIRQYNLEVMAHRELLSFIIPIDDGLAVSVKTPQDVHSRIPGVTFEGF